MVQPKGSFKNISYIWSDLEKWLGFIIFSAPLVLQIFPCILHLQSIAQDKNAYLGIFFTPGKMNWRFSPICMPLFRGSISTSHFSIMQFTLCMSKIAATFMCSDTQVSLLPGDNNFLTRFFFYLSFFLSFFQCLHLSMSQLILSLSWYKNSVA